MKSFKILALIVLFFGFAANDSFAQEVSRSALEPRSRPVETTQIPDGDGRIHITDEIVRTPLGKKSLENFIHARDAGLLRAGKTAASYSIGEEKQFLVAKSRAESQTMVKKTFVLRGQGDVVNVWVDKPISEVTADAELDEIMEAILEKTPANSFRPDRGIIENDNYLFGSPPNVDGDGVVDILMYDIVEGEGGCCVLGFVSSVDLDPNGTGNRADILHVDAKEGLSRGTASLSETIAHEYTHLIHFNYDFSDDVGFMAEGIAEWASLVNGYDARVMRFLQDRNEHNTPLFEFRSEIGPSDNDYQRGGLFTQYISERIGIEDTGGLIQIRTADGSKYASGEEAYTQMVAPHGLTFGEVVADFHVANIVNDDAVDAKFAYTPPSLQALNTVYTVEVDGGAQTDHAIEPLDLNGGAFRYISYSNVADFELTFDVHSGVLPIFHESIRKKGRVTVIGERLDGTMEIERVAVGEDTHLFSGDFARLTVVLTNTNMGTTSYKYDLNASWGTIGGGSVERQIVAHDGGSAVETQLESSSGGFAKYLTVGADAREASRFVVPQNGRLSKVHVAPMYENQFSDSDVPDGTARDFRLHVWADDGTGVPGEELYAVDVTDAPTGTHVDYSTGAYSFLEHTLPSDESVLSSLPDVVHIGISNTGSDENYLVVTVAENEGDGASSLFLPSFGPNDSGGWAMLSDIFVTDDNRDTTYVFGDVVFPIRAEFVVSTSTDIEGFDELPEQVTLAQNYPNPFNPATSISFTLPKTMQVRLAVYDALGREVATMVDGVQTSGSHTVQLDASQWASGVYFYTLETEAQAVSKRMVLMK